MVGLLHAMALWCFCLSLMVGLLHAMALWCFCLSAESYETINHYHYHGTRRYHYGFFAYALQYNN